MKRDRADIKRLRVEAEIDQLKAQVADLERKVLARKIVAGLREIARERGCCPVCRSAVADPTPGAGG